MQVLLRQQLNKLGTLKCNYFKKIKDKKITENI